MLVQSKKPLLSVVLVTQLVMLFYATPVSGEDRNIDQSINKGISYLYEKQLHNGEFTAFISYSPDMSDAMNASTVFDTSFIVHTLNLADNKHTEKIVQEMKTKALAFLLDNMESHNIWRYQGKSQTIVYPPDTDDTSMVFSALVESGVNISDESLDYMLNFRTPDGIFYTWINSDEWLDPSFQDYEKYKQNDIDANVNANVLYAYSLRNRNQYSVINYLNNMAENKSFLNGTPYYQSPYVFSYVVTRDYSDGGIKELEPSLDNLKDYVLETQNADGGWGNDIDTAFATITLINIGYEGAPLEKAIEHILNNQRKNGSWRSNPFYIAYHPDTSITFYYGSQELTTSFSLEALIKYNNILSRR
ncbi:MAG: hypothetical protein OIN66_17400 [Candidatus Methanoperedens sp.]|nr:hypothetical protein [Candidatus Methanoperedens sp.]